LAAACKIGALCGGLDSNSVNALNDYGYNFGMAFQIIDDLLDLTSSTEITGKTTQNDIKEGVYTLPLLLGLASDHSTKIKSLLNKQSVSYEMYATLVRVLKDQGAVDQALTITLTYSQLASEALSALDQTCIVKGLIKLPELYLSQSWRK
jgi:geranylgeranyl pyrophosphate synthase